MSTLNQTDKRANLINDLSANLSPVRANLNIGIVILLWFFSSWVYVISLSLYLGPLRQGVL